MSTDPFNDPDLKAYDLLKEQREFYRDRCFDTSLSKEEHERYVRIYGDLVKRSAAHIEKVKSRYPERSQTAQEQEEQAKKVRNDLAEMGFELTPEKVKSILETRKIPSSFIEDKFYLMAGSGQRWEDFEGPFDSAQLAFQDLKYLAHELSSPEMLNIVVCSFKNNVLDLVKDDEGRPINGHLYKSGDQVVYQGTKLEKI